MKQYLILTLIAVAAGIGAHSLSPVTQQVSDTRAAMAPKLSVPIASSLGRQLSEQERAELRRQLYDFSRPAQGKRS